MSTPDEIRKQVEILNDPNNKPMEEKLTAKQLAQSFIESRLRQGSAIEELKSSAINKLRSKITDDTSPMELLKIIEVLDRCTSTDMDRLVEVSVGSNKNGQSGLLDMVNEKLPQEMKLSSADPKTMKLLASIVNAIPLIKAINRENK